MSKLLDFTGENEFLPRGLLYTNPKDSNFFLSIGNHVDLYFPSRKRARISDKLVLIGQNLKTKEGTSIDVLPDECLFEIFRRLPGAGRSVCACVSRRWLSLLSNIGRDELCSGQESSNIESYDDDGLLSRSLEGKKATDVRLAAIAVGSAGLGGLGKLSIRGGDGNSKVTTVGLRAIARGCSSLKVLTLWNLPDVDDNGLLEIASGCQQLEKLHLFQCPGITNRGLIAIAKNCTRLSDLVLESCSGVGNECLQIVGKNCTNLKSLSIKDCSLVGDHGISSLVSSTSLTLSKLKIQSLNISEISLAVIGQYGKAITDLTLANLPKVSERGFWVMANAQGLQKLKVFTVTSCKGVSDVALEAVGKSCPNLKHIYIRKCAILSDIGVVAFSKASLSLESLHLEECHRVTHYGVFGSLINCGDKLKALSLVKCLGIQDLNPALPMLSPCKSLQNLSIHNCPGFGDKSVAFLGMLCPQLQNIELVGLHGVTDAGFFPLVKNSQAGLVKVNLSGCLNLSDVVVSALAHLHGATLEVLNLEGCRMITDSSLESVANNCKCLSDLDASKCAITDAGIAALAHSTGLSLQILSVSGCSAVSNKSMPSFLRLGRTLLGLNLLHCNAVSVSSVNALVDRLFKCDILA